MSLFNTLPLTTFHNHCYYFAVAMATLVYDMYTVNEADGFVMICANLTDGVLERTITIYFNTAPGTAIGETNSREVGSAIAPEFLGR